MEMPMAAVTGRIPDPPQHASWSLVGEKLAVIVVSRRLELVSNLANSS
jgi:hypothetical protein